MNSGYSIKFKLGKYFFADQFYPEYEGGKHWYWFIGKNVGPGSYKEIIRF